MAVSIQDLINKKDGIVAGRTATYDLETSIGTITVKKPSRAFVLEALGLSDAAESDAYMVLNMTAEPNLKDTELQKAYGCMDPLDIIGKLFDSGETAAISKAIMKCAGYGDNIKAEVHEEAKN